MNGSDGTAFARGSPSGVESPPTLTRFSHIYDSDGLDTTLLFQGCVLGTASTVGMGGGGQSVPSQDREGASDCPGPALRPASSHVLLISYSNS